MKLPLRLVVRALSVLALAAGAIACGESDDPERVCIPGVTQTCSCPGDRLGTQSCVEDGTAFGRCLCPNPDAAMPDAGAPDTWRPDSTTTDAGRPDSLRADSSSDDLRALDRALALDRVLASDVSRLDRALFDRVGVDARAVDAGDLDAALSDTQRADTLRLDTLRADTLQRDTAPGVDATIPFDAAGYAGIGESCSGVACVAPLLCTSAASGGFFCRARCMPETGDCAPATESCVNVTGVDGGSCVPGSAPPAPCDLDDPPCADLYVCAAMTTDFLCRYKCDPQAVDAGCASGPCYQITGTNYGACF